MILYKNKKNVEQKGCKKIPMFYWTTMPGGRPSKKARTNTNLSGPDRSDDYDSDLEIDDDDLELLIHFDSLKANYKREGEVMNVNGEAEDEEISVWEGFQQEDLADAMLDMFEEEDEKDLDWLPPKLEARRNKTQ